MLSLKNPTKGSVPSLNPVVAIAHFKSWPKHPPGDPGFGRRDIFQTALGGNTATGVTYCWFGLGGRQGNTNTWKRKPNQRHTEQGHGEPC